MTNDSGDAQDTNTITYGVILVLSTWYQNTVVGIVALCIVAVMELITIIKIGGRKGNEVMNYFLILLIFVFLNILQNH
jgi:hypothetical protein